MASITTRELSGTGVTISPNPLSNQQLDQNFINLNDELAQKLPLSGGTLTGALTVGGNLTVNGTTFTINSTTVTVDDPIFSLGGDTVPTTDDNKDRGIEFRWHNGSVAKLGFFGFDDSTGKFTFVPDATNTSEVFSGTKGTIDANIEWADVLSKPNYVASVATTSPLSGGAAGSVGGALTLSLAAGYGDTQNPYGSKTTSTFLAAPSAGNGAPSFRAIVASDIPTLNQSTTGNAATATTWQNARNFTIGSTTRSVDGSAAVSWTRSEIVGSPPGPGGYFSNTSPIVQSDGVMEIGRYIDFHATNTTTSDFDIRLECTAANAISFIGTAATTVTAGTFSGALTGNATTATTLQTARNINGVSFNGSADITIADSTKLPLAGGTLTGTLTVPSALFVSAQGGAEGGEIVLRKGAGQTGVAGDLVFDYQGNTVRFFENGGSFRQFLLDLTNGNISGVNGIVANINGNAATVTNGVYTTGDQSIAGTKIFTGAVSVVGQTINNQSHYQWEGATFRNPSDWTASFIVRRDNATAGINGHIPSLVLYNNNGGDQTTVGLSFASAEGATGQGNAVALAGILARKEGAGTAGAWSSGSLNFYVKNGGTRVDAANITSSGVFNALVGLQQAGNQVVHAGNVSTYALPIGGGTLTGQLNIATSTNISFGNQTRQMINLWGTQYGIGVQSSTTYFRSDSRFSWHRGGSHSDTENTPGSGGTTAMTLDGSSGLYVTGLIRAPQITAGGSTNTDVQFGVQGTSHLAGTVYYGGTVGNFNSWSSRLTSSAGQHTLSVSRFTVNRDGYGSQALIDANLGLITLGQQVRVDGGIEQGNNLARPLVQWSATSATGMVYFELPGTTSNYGMVHMVFDIYEYNSNTVSTVVVGGHNWQSAWYNVAANVIGLTDKPVRLGVRSGKYVVCFGTASSAWTYGTIILRKIHNGGYYDNIIDMAGTFTAAITTSESLTWDSGDLRALRTPASFNAVGAITQNGNQVLHAGNVSTYALPIGGGTMTGVITTPNGTHGIIIGDDSRLADRNVSNTLFVEGNQNNDRGYINFSSTTGNSLGAINGGDLTWRGNSVLHASNYSSYALPLSGGTVTGDLILGGRNIRIFESNSYLEFTVAGDQNTYYPVLFSNYAWYHFGTWSISRSYADTAPWDPIGTGAHKGGLTLTWQWSGDGAWGGNDKTIRVLQFAESYTTMVGGMALSVNGLIVWLRGGGAYYRFHGPGGVGNGATPYYSTYTASNGATYPVRSYNATTVTNEVTNKMPIRGESEHWDGGNRVLHAGNYNSYSPTLTGGNASGTWGINITGSAGSAPANGGTATALNSSNYIARTGSSGNLNTDFNNTPAGTFRYQGDDSNLTNSPGGTWWIYEHKRHSNSGNYWGTQIAWGWEDNANSLAQRNVTGGSWSGWVRYLNSSNYNSYSPTLTGGNASGTWSISITGNAATVSPDTNIRVKLLTFTGEGGDSGNGSQPTGYGIYQQGGSWTYPYPDLCIGFHTGIKIGAHYSYNGTRFYNNSDWATEIFSVGNGDNNVRVANTLYSYAYRGNGNVGGTGEATYHPAGIYSTGTNWLYGTIYTNSYGIDANNALCNLNASKARRADGNFYIDDNYGCGIVGVYTSTRYQGVFAMGDSYKLPADGTTTGNLYGIAWSHPNAGGAAGNLDSHGLLVLINGGFGSAMSYSIVASGNVTAYSDERLKTNWKPMPASYVSKLAGVKVGIYDRLDGEKITQVGVSAQSLQQVLPEAIITADDDIKTLSINYGGAALASAVELAKDNLELRSRIERLEALVEKLLTKE